MKRFLILSSKTKKMTSHKIARNTLYCLFSLAIGIAFFTSCSSEPSYEDVEIPTQGLITTVQEVQAESYKITDEQAVQDTADSRIVAVYMDSTRDTFTLAQARLAQQSGYTGHRSGVFSAASFGFMGFMMGRSMSRFRPSSSAYMDQKTYNKVNSTAGNSVRSSAKTVRKPSTRSSKGFGSGRSTRSHGG